jgi:hypothetical protein
MALFQRKDTLFRTIPVKLCCLPGVCRTTWEDEREMHEGKEHQVKLADGLLQLSPAPKRGSGAP